MREETHCHHMGYSFRLAARVLLYASSHRQNNTYNSLCYTSRGALAGTRNGSTMKDRSDDPSHHERTLLPRSYISLLNHNRGTMQINVLSVIMLHKTLLIITIFSFLLCFPDSCLDHGSIRHPLRRWILLLPDPVSARLPHPPPTGQTNDDRGWACQV